MAHAVISPEGWRDLEDIAARIAAHDVDTADRLTRELLRRCDMLAQLPHLGRRRPDIREDMRSFAVGAYVILYTIDEVDVLIRRVLRGSRDIAAPLAKGSDD